MKCKNEVLLIVTGTNYNKEDRQYQNVSKIMKNVTTGKLIAIRGKRGYEK
jgi:hypothetical protein